MNLLAPIKEIMVKDVITLPSTAPISEANEIFKRKSFHHIPVVDNNKLVGIISKSDFVFFRRGFKTDALKQELENIRAYNFVVADFMTTKMATLEPDDKINVALEVFKANLFHAIPIAKDGELKGIVTTFDIINSLAKSKGATATYE